MSRAKLISALIAGLVFASPVSAADDKPNQVVSLQPSTDWNIDFGEDQCRLARVFGEGDDKHILFFEQAGPDTGFGLTLAGPRLRQFRMIIPRLGLKPEDGFPQVSDKSGEVVGYGPAVIFSRLSINDYSESEPEAGELRSLPQIDLDEASKITRILYGHGGKALGFETGDLGPPLQALNVCAADFLRAWGLDPEKHENFKRMARWMDRDERVRQIQKKYTHAAAARGEEAILRMRVIIELDGSVSECTLVQATVTKRIKSNACKEMKKAEFEPALDADGQPMRSFFTTNIIYRIKQNNAHG